MSIISENYFQIKSNIATAAKQAGRNPEDVLLIAVTKYIDEARIAEAIDCGITAIGENRVQELLQKLDFFNRRAVDINLIGQLQTNKVKYIINKVGTIQSVDRESLVLEINRQAEKNACIQNVFIEVNIGCEPQKGGITPEALPRFLELVATMPSIYVRGLMCIPPAVGEAEVQKYFAQMRELAAFCEGLGLPNANKFELSMGMSGDYKIAVAEGATMVRVGTALFGDRY